MSRGKPWTRDELIVAFNLYCGLPFGQLHNRNPVIIEMSQKLDRTPSSVAMKLVNFASLDPMHIARGVKGLQGASEGDRQIWKEFHQDWNGLALQSEQILRRIATTLPVTRKEFVERYDDLPDIPFGTPTEGSRVQQFRLLQGFFRRTVLAAYKSTCCMTGNPVRELLVASHILPWKGFPEHRVDPSNGLCLAAHFDRAFDRGLIAFDGGGRLLISPMLKLHLPNRTLQQEFFDREGQSLKMPERFPPNSSFLEHHRKNLFLRRKTASV
jgi:predicted restriction endonuclease